MNATMMSMEHAYVDNLSADQLLEGDLIEIEDNVVEIIALSPTKNGIVITYKNDFDEKEIQEFPDDTIFKLFVLM
jgi:hypothetical protein